MDVEIATGQECSPLIFSEATGTWRIGFSSRATSNHYPEGVNDAARRPQIPAEALARQARLQAALQDMEAAAPSREAPCLQGFRALLLENPAGSESAAWLDALVAADLVEEAGEILRLAKRQAADRKVIEAVTSRLSPVIQKAQQRRAALWHLDSRRTLIRFQFSKGGAAVDFDDGDLHAVFLQAFRLEGFRLALDLGKRPRPLLNLGLPLPAQVGGRAEWADAVLKQEPAEAPADLMRRLNHRLPSGLDLHQWETLPTFAAPISERAGSSHWLWPVPADLRVKLEPRVAAFVAASSWPWDRGGARAESPLDLRAIIFRLEWEGEALGFSSQMGEHSALNPMKALAALLGLDPARLAGLTRLGVDLKPDQRLAQAERFVPKLKNMYEDAVLLGAGSNITLVDEDDDEPIRLG